MPSLIDWRRTVSLDRREFIKLAGTTVACTCIGLLGASGCGSNPTSSTPHAPKGSYHIQDGHVFLEISEVGTLLGVGALERKVILVRPGETDYRAFANACTHNGKELNYLHEDGLLACCGRSSRFNLAGEVIHGPAEDALPSYRVWQEGDELVIEI